MTRDSRIPLQQVLAFIAAPLVAAQSPLEQSTTSSSSSTLQTKSTSTHTTLPGENLIPTATDPAPALTPNPLPTTSTNSSSAHNSTSTTHPNQNGTSSSGGTSNPGAPLSSEEQSTDGLVNYYFVFCALAICVIGIIVWIWFRRRKRRRMRSRTSERDALARDVDLDAYPSGRRGRVRADGRRVGGDDGIGGGEGLNEEGEAPPPYKPGRASGEGNGEVRRPENAVLRAEVGMKPPDYEERGGQA